MSDLLRRDVPGWWGLAFAGSLALHGTGLALWFDLIPWHGWPQPAPTTQAEITVASLILTEDQLAAAEAPPEAAPAPTPPEPPAPVPTPEPEQAPDPAPEAEPAPEPPAVEPPTAEPVPAPEPMPVAEAPAPPPEATENPLLAAPGAAATAGPGGLGDVSPPGPTAEAPAPEPPPAAPIDPEPAPVQPVPAQPAPVAAPAALAPPLVAPPPLTPDAASLRRLALRLRGQFGASCLIALPQLGDGRAPAVVMLSDRDRSMVDFAKTVLPDPETPDRPPPANRAVLVDARQCAAVNFLRARAEYPAFGLSLGLVSDAVLSGGRLIGSIEGAAPGTQTALLLVDDNGVVQDLRRFLRFAGGRTEFDVPVTRDGDARDTAQMLIALASPTRLATVTNMAGRSAEEFFPALQKELDKRTALAVLPFDLR
ncbi:hypothetical protein C8J30_10617 [Rhodobacter viridis]|uniref:Uncharacterized protein n=1 Tax=Rhodobacter viridis TaxID=1054202 RepID=A0A318U141_9RHOB|nr:hypothetical protein [Rhodobacter viridis]PYF09885.1 hypothetical protein C8J30_10617 [Rhodobacter viridis]